MKLGKKSMYFLFPALIAIWGLLGYRIYTTFSNRKPISKPVELTIKNESIDSEKEKFIPSLNYSDPFLKKHRADNNISKPMKSVVETTIEVQRVKPKAEYLGFISGQKGGQKQAIVGYNKNVFVLSSGDSIGSFIIASISVDTLSLKDGEMYWKYGLKP
ncbi:MAG TPA: hypothetical protein DG754_06445 [Bacteroidales bacterium]|jgi:hypothetical protein|nr:hypothetical protein [Bacteroidales bacterium]